METEAAQQTGSNEDIEKKLQDMEAENLRLIDEFNSQRAKMKELFLQKDSELLLKSQENLLLNETILKLTNELDDIKSQLVVDSMTLESNFENEKRKAKEEIATLQTLVHETIEESSSTRSLYDKELEKLQTYIEHLQKELKIVKEEHKQSPAHSSQEHSLAPSVVLNALTKGIKKLGADTFSSFDEDSSKKAQEDTELLKSLVEPLEDQIKALKEKLRATDEQLQKCQECRHSWEPHGSWEMVKKSTDHVDLQSTAATNTSFDMPKTEVGLCDMCSNYEAELVKEQQKNSELTVKLQAAEKAVERHREDLLKEIGFRKEMEEKWNEKKEEHKQQVAELTRSTECTEQDLKELRQYFNETCIEMKTNIAKVTRERERIQKELDKLQKDNDTLVGKYTMHSQVLQSEAINLPNTVEELHELILTIHQDLIIAKIGKESAEEKLNNFQSELMLFRDQVKNEQHERKVVEDTLDQEIKTLKKQLHQLEKEKKQALGNQEKLLTSDKARQDRVSELEDKVTELTSTIKNLENQNSELRKSVHSLQQELDTTETVQKDFVRLSQSLQVQLEKIRELDHQVRWQHEEDVEECPGCRTPFTNAKRKQHCRHCGQIFCPSCLSRTVQSGPNLRPSKVCDVCHTILVRSSAPYFSEAPPMN